MIAELRAAYPEATIDVLASPSNHEVFEADPHVNRVQVAERTWFERRPERWGLVTAVWKLGRSLREHRYDLGIDVRGDVLSVLVLALARVPRRVGWSMGGGSFLLTDVAAWIPGPARGPLAAGASGKAGNHSRRARSSRSDGARSSIGSRSRGGLRKPGRADRSGAREAFVRVAGRERILESRLRSRTSPARNCDRERPTGCTRIAFRRFRRFWRCTWGPEMPPSAGRLGRGRCWSSGSWRVAGGWWSSVESMMFRFRACSSRTTGCAIGPARMTVAQTTAFLERADLFIGADSGPAHLAASAGTLSVILFSGTNQARQWRPWSRHSLVLRHRVPCHPCHQKVCPLGGPSLHGRSASGPGLPRSDAVVDAHPPGRVAACSDLKICLSGIARGQSMKH